jgi:hypothetical protein
MGADVCTSRPREHLLMPRNIPARLILIIVAATTGCQTTGLRSIEALPDNLTVTRTFPARFDAVKLAMQEALRDPAAMRRIAGIDYSTPVQTNSWTSKTPFRKVATRQMQNGERTIKVKIEQRREGVVVSARVSTGAPGDPARSAALMDRIGESVALERAGR